MNKEVKEQAFSMLEDIMKLSLHYCKDSDEEIKSYSIRVNNIAHELKILLERHGD
tara:strand:- start:1108 stop:1272 length:165 start_codon:yes stop_codon:yes gene_type:complete